MRVGEALGKKIAVISALGGQGSTLSAAYLSKAAADLGHAAAAVDLCGFGGTLAHMLGVGEQINMHIGDAASGACELEEALTDCGENLRILPASAFSETPLPPYSVEARRVVEELSRQGDVVADLPSGTVPDCGAVNCFDVMVICSRADKLSLQYAAALRRLLGRAREQAACGCEFRLLLTDFSPETMRSGGAVYAGSIDECIDAVGARLLGVLPHDLSAMEAALSGQPPDTGSPLMRYARDAARRIFGETVPLDEKMTLRTILRK